MTKTVELRQFIDEIIYEHQNEIGNWIINSPGSMSSNKADNDKLAATIKRWEAKRDELLPLKKPVICQNCEKEFSPHREDGQCFCSRRCADAKGQRRRRMEAKANAS
jgi:hypothetical protein